MRGEDSIHISRAFCARRDHHRHMVRHRHMVPCHRRFLLPCRRPMPVVLPLTVPLLTRPACLSAFVCGSLRSLADHRRITKRIPLWALNVFEVHIHIALQVDLQNSLLCKEFYKSTCKTLYYVKRFTSDPNVNEYEFSLNGFRARSMLTKIRLVWSLCDLPDYSQRPIPASSSTQPPTPQLLCFWRCLNCQGWTNSRFSSGCTAW